MPISIHPLLPSDIPTAAYLELEAFRSHPNTPYQWPRGYTRDLYAWHEAGMEKTLADPRGSMVKAVDEETGEMVGNGEWEFVLDVERDGRGKGSGGEDGEERKGEERKGKEGKEDEEDDIDPEPPGNWPEGGNWALRNFFNRNMRKWDEEWLRGRRYICAYRSSSPLTHLPD